MGTVVSTSDITPAEREPFAGIPPVEPADFETSPEKRDRALKHLLRANHQNYSVLYSNLVFHNHTPHVCTSTLETSPAVIKRSADVGNRLLPRCASGASPHPVRGGSGRPRTMGRRARGD